MQGLDYAYTLQGWIKALNASALSPGNDMGKDGFIASNTTANTTIARDAFAYSLSYFRNDYKQICPISTTNPTIEMAATVTTANFTSASPDLFNGNIRGITQQISGIGTQPRGYAYRYDQLHRLKEMDTWERTGTNFDWNVPAAPLTAFSERVSYDANGNITTYNRKAGGTNIEMDNLTYGYHANSNKLRIVNDAVAATNYTEDIDNQVGTSIPNPALPGQNYAANYQYDASGNLISDHSQGSAITWNTYGKVKQVVRTGTTASTLTFGYDAMQQRIVKTFTANNNTTKTYYIRDAQGNVMATYDLSNNQLILKEMNLYGSSRLGTLNPFFQTFPAPSGGMANSLGNRQYELTNHLGNVMATVRDTRTGVDTDANGTANYFTANVASAQEYYPFGMTMPGRVVAGAVGYKYGFNGKEQDRTEWGGPAYDYGFRIYDARVGRFLSVDPISSKYPELTPYQFASNTPIQAIDLDGLEKAEIINAFKFAGNKTKQLVVQTVEGVGNLIAHPIDGTKAIINNTGETASDVGYLAKTWVDIVYGQATGKPAEVDTEKFREKAHDLGKGIVKTAALAPLTELTLGTANVVPKVLQSGKPIVKAEVAAPVLVVEEIAAPAAKVVHPLRAAYVSEVEGLSSAASKMRAAGSSSEEIARTLHRARRELGVKYKSLTPDTQLQQIYQRNLEKYGDKLGPTIDYLRQKGKSWDDIIDSATRTGGKDLGL